MNKFIYIGCVIVDCKEEISIAENEEDLCIKLYNSIKKKVKDDLYIFLHSFSFLIV